VALNRVVAGIHDSLPKINLQIHTVGQAPNLDEAMRQKAIPTIAASPSFLNFKTFGPVVSWINSSTTGD